VEIDDGVRSFIDSVPVGRLATVGSNGAPHVVPICYALDAAVLYTPIDEKPKREGRLRRLHNIEANPRVQVLIDRYDDDWSLLRYVQLRGQSELLEAGSEHARAIGLLRARYEQYRSMDLEHRPVIAVRIERVVEWRFAR
jgi:PPOX class probable F420-dependent enzyme